MLKKAVRQGRSKRRGEAYSPQYVEPLSVAGMPLADFFNSQLGSYHDIEKGSMHMHARVALDEAAFLEPIHKETHA